MGSSFSLFQVEKLANQRETLLEAFEDTCSKAGPIVEDFYLKKLEEKIKVLQPRTLFTIFIIPFFRYRTFNSNIKSLNTSFLIDYIV